MSSLIATKRTTPTMRDFADALLVSWPGATKEGAGVLWAHFAGETQDGYHCYNNNLGNVKWTPGCGLDYVSLVGVWEGFKIGDEDKDGDVDEDDRVMLVNRLIQTGLWKIDPSLDHAKAVGPGKVSMLATTAHAATWFRAYPSLLSGMDAFVELKRDPRSRYARAWFYVESGDPKGYAYALGDKGYYTASKDVYAAAMKRKYDAWMASEAFREARMEAQTQPDGLTPGSYRAEQPPRTVTRMPDTNPYDGLENDPDDVA